MERQLEPDRKIDATQRFLWKRSALSLLLVVFCLSSFSGCQIVIGVMQIFQGFPKTPSDFSVKTHKRSLAEKGKRVVILSTSTPSALAEEPSLDLDIMASISRRFKVEKIKIVSPDKVARWIDEQGQITLATEIEPLAKEFNADFVVLFSFEEFGYQEENSPGMHRGYANGRIVVSEIVDDGVTPGKKRAKNIYNAPFTMKYPGNRAISVDQEGPAVFKRRFMGALTNFLARKFIDYRPEEEIQ